LSKRGIIVGGGAFAREALNWLWESGSQNAADNFGCFLDSDPTAFSGFEDFSVTHLGDPETFVPDADDIFLMAIGGPLAKDKIASRLEKLGAVFLTVIHQSAVVSRTATIGHGVVIGPHAYVATNAALGDFACVNSLTGIGHDTVVGRSSTVSSQVDITGQVALGDRVFVGSGARVLPGVRVGEDAKIGAGSIVVRDMKANSSVFAQPARKI
jgi:sugar O-acyltransferase (sialic acid O-acetyltransferase NeuD family)